MTPRRKGYPKPTASPHGNPGSYGRPPAASETPGFVAPGSALRIGLYARVSRDDGVQDVGNQLDELRRWAGQLGGTVVIEYVDRASGTKSASDRAGLAAALRGAHERRFDVLLIWALDRLSRGGIGAVAGILEKLKTAGVGLKSWREPWLDVSSPLVSELLIAVFSWAAAMERSQLVARTKAGLDRARRQGRTLGRPLVIDSNQARAALAKCGSLRRAAAELGCSEASIRRRLANTEVADQ